ncbi:hypothetical protein VHEMI06058 [[Torrubiella] hemipterigena]|uniref:Uncharacterized protein n=1 Tax=[Torrubiella] hemipterigena TaxID=1531966 RepID=A0A0A1T635_9HYPO|nr:hypothetical protein VHEMI06058 [[Torrubiella] hemipterigena]
MAIWPFRRKSVRKRMRSATESDAIPPRGRQDSGLARAASKKKNSQPAKLQRRARTYSFSPGREDAILAQRIATGKAPANSNSATPFERVPTLYHKRSDLQPARRKSSKRRREDHEREAEIKAMSAQMPQLPVEDIWPAERLRRDSIKRSKTNKSTASWRDQPSDVSLPMSFHSANAANLDSTEYKVPFFSSLAPRPTLRYTPSQRQASRNQSAVRSQSSRKPGASETIQEERLDESKRMDDLADGLDSSDLRELMERDYRRRERQRVIDQEKLERRLARKAERAKQEIREASESGTPPPQNHERGVLGRELVGLGIDPPSAVVTSSQHRDSPSPNAMSIVEDQTGGRSSPLESFQPVDASEEPRAPANEPVAIAQEMGTPLPELPSKAGFLRSKKSRSKSTLASDKDKIGSGDDYDPPRKESNASTHGTRRSFSFFLKWGNRGKRNSGGPSSFSNTSREEMQFAAAQSQISIAQAQAEALAKLQGEDLPRESTSLPTMGASPFVNKPSSGMPKRTKSRFREDLPDFPLSPPDSRVQSPEADPPLPSVAEANSPEIKTQPIPIPQPGGAYPNRSIENIMHTSMPNRLSGTNSSDPHMSISLASIDSEGSWLSGRGGNRRSQALRDSIARANRREAGQSSTSLSNSTREDLAITDDEYLSRVTPTRSGQERLSGEGVPSSDDERVSSEGAKWGTVGAQPNVVIGDRNTMHSHHGLLNTTDSGDDSGTDSPISPSVVEAASLERAHSVNMGKGHARNFSAGSARLLDITPRGSVDGKRRSGGGLKTVETNGEVKQ